MWMRRRRDLVATSGGGYGQHTGSTTRLDSTRRGFRLADRVAEALNRLGELATRTSATSQARDQHTQALAIARDISAAPEEARALEGLGHGHLQDGNPGHAAAHLRQALAIYERIGAPGAKRVEETSDTTS
jgi:Flp pilus assembly protein TadD